tara:strand:+ start:183 stop:458 length:276 start_codon:yes stop_codon:yes gene_type:complete
MANEDSSVKEQWNNIPGWFKVIIGAAGILMSFKLFPILELLNLFALIVLVPLCLFASFGLIADGAGSSARNAWNSTMAKAKEEAQKMAKAS